MQYGAAGRGGVGGAGAGGSVGGAAGGAGVAGAGSLDVEAEREAVRGGGGGGRGGGGAGPDLLGRVGAQVERELLGSVRSRQQRAAGVEARRIRLDVTALAGLGDRLLDTGQGGLGALTCGEDVELGALLVRQVVDRQAAEDVVEDGAGDPQEIGRAHV